MSTMDVKGINKLKKLVSEVDVSSHCHRHRHDFIVRASRPELLL
jgi:hypothetical protein